VIGARILHEREIWTVTATIGRDPLERPGDGGVVYRLERETQPARWMPRRRIVAYASGAQWALVIMRPG
jgi:hypothetical protein